MGEGVKHVLPPVTALPAINRADLDNAVLVHADFERPGGNSIGCGDIRVGQAAVEAAPQILEDLESPHVT